MHSAHWLHVEEKMLWLIYVRSSVGVNDVFHTFQGCCSLFSWFLHYEYIITCLCINVCVTLLLYQQLSITLLKADILLYSNTIHRLCSFEVFKVPKMYRKYSNCFEFRQAAYLFFYYQCICWTACVNLCVDSV